MTLAHRLIFPVAVALLLAGKCGDDPPATDDSTVEGDADADSDSDTDTDSDSDGDTDLPDLSTEMETEYCDTAAGREDSVGATEYYLGLLSRDGETGWTGTETLYIWATSEWEAAGGADCVAVWDLHGATTGVSSCAGCEYAVALDATLNVGATTCPGSFTQGAHTWSSTYDIDEHEDGTIDVFFADTGNPLGGGLFNASGLTYLSNRTCIWF